ncbi:phage tail protein [Cedecea neteri]|uniref:phage tail protein n=1 Tax=Cedecea neteri TaxID=158822 RepID=UPI002892CB69|nr:phage tail protein [Cedecea neteri]WNJ80518.1 phage tail protein [Cedecea neteri]
MTQKYYAILTNQGAARLANAAALGTKLNLTQMGVGDANGVLPVPDPAQTKLINQWRIAALNQLSVDPKNPGQIIAEQIIAEDDGGKWIREIGLYDDEGVLIAVANCPETYKPLLQEGSGRTQTIRMILIVSSAAAITLKIDPSVVLATRKYVDDAVIEVKSYADNLMGEHVKAPHPHKQYLRTSESLSEIAALGSEAVAKTLANLGLGNLALAGVATGFLGESISGGYWKVPGVVNGQKKELIIQWYTAKAPEAGFFNFNFPIPFPNAFFADAAMAGGSGGGIVNGGNVSKTTRQLYCSTPMSVAMITVGW